VKSLQPYVVVFYGSRERGDFDSLSDFNFYLLASGLDHMRKEFLDDVSDRLELAFDTKITTNSNDFSMFKYRLSLFEPTSVHIMEMGRAIFGSESFQKYQDYWTTIKQGNIPVKDIVNFLESRSKFYKTLQSRSLQDDIIRIEKVISLNIQMWVFAEIQDISPIEIAHLDIPERLPKLIKYLYKGELPNEIFLLTSIYEQVHELKKNLRMLETGKNSDLEKLKESILQIQEFSNEIARIK
jgi:predicted nucleotidyltransferase